MNILEDQTRVHPVQEIVQSKDADTLTMSSIMWCMNYPEYRRLVVERMEKARRQELQNEYHGLLGSCNLWYNRITNP